MEIEEKINEIGKMCADINLQVSIIKRRQHEIRQWLLFPDKLKVEQDVNKHLGVK